MRLARLNASALAATAFAAATLTAAAWTSTTALAGGVLRLDEVAVGELDPAKATDYADSILIFNVYDALVTPAPGGGQVQPHLAESWDWDGDSVTFTLRSGVASHGGGEITASDVVFSFERAVALGQGFSFLFADHVTAIEAIGDNQVRFTLNEPFAPFLASLTRLAVVDAETVMDNLADGDFGELGDYGQAYLNGADAGSGAYEVTSHNPLELTVMAKFDGYFLGAPDAAPDEVRLRYGLEAPTVRTLISRGEHDISSQWLPPEIARALAEDGAQLLTESGDGLFYVKLNTQKPPLDDVHCRLALANALDYATMIGLLAITDEVSGGAPANGPLPAGMLGHDPDAPMMVMNLDAAAAHLEQCAYDPAETTLEVSWIAEVPLEERFALLMQDNFSRLGFNVEVERVPWALFTERVTSIETTPNISQVFVSAVTPDPDALIYNMYHSSAAGTWQSTEWLNDAHVDDLLDRGRVETDGAKRDAIYRELSNYLVGLAPSLYAYDQQAVFVASNRVTAPSLSDPAQGFGVSGANFQFRLMDVAD